MYPVSSKHFSHVGGPDSRLPTLDADALLRSRCTSDPYFIFVKYPIGVSFSLLYQVYILNTFSFFQHSLLGRHILWIYFVCCGFLHIVLNLRVKPLPLGSRYKKRCVARISSTCLHNAILSTTAAPRQSLTDDVVYIAHLIVGRLQASAVTCSI